MNRKSRENLEILAQGRRMAQDQGDANLDFLLDTAEQLSRILNPGDPESPEACDEPPIAVARRNPRLNARQRAREHRQRLERFLAHIEEVNRPLGEAVDAVLAALGYHRHNRGEWVLHHASTAFLLFRNEVHAMNTPNSTRIGANANTQVMVEHLAGPQSLTLQEYVKQREMEKAAGPSPGPKSKKKGKKKTAQPLVVQLPPDPDPEMRKVFARANRGDKDALVRVRCWVRERQWVDRMGNLGREATQQLLAMVSAGSPVWSIGLEEMAAQFLAEVEGERPSVLEKLLARRVLNNWIAVHALEVERAVKNPKCDQLEHLDKAISRADHRFRRSIHELAQVRRLQAPRVLQEACYTGSRIPCEDRDAENQAERGAAIGKNEELEPGCGGNG